MEWYYAVNNQRQGPVAQADFDRLVADGVVKPETLVWQQGMADWKPYSTIAATLPPPADAGDDTAVCAVSGKRYPKREMIQYEGKWISAEHRDTFFQRLREGVANPGDGPVPGPFGYGGFWRRVGAKFVDGIIAQAFNVVFALAAGAMVGAPKDPQPDQMRRFIAAQAVYLSLAFAFAFSYDLFFMWKFAATPGKMALGLKVVRADGSKLSVPRIIGRFFAHIIDGLTIGIGYLMAAFDDEKRALHDRICDTRVIKTR
jgi:uncharacterized RDD family membrane protein YckC